jgi:tRNA(Ile)-lysidine synthase
VSAADQPRPIGVAEARQLFADLSDTPSLTLAVSGGPDSVALMFLAARWRHARKHGPQLAAVTVDHGLRQESAREAAAVKRLAEQLGVTHQTVRWRGPKPRTGIQEKARAARYRLLIQAARKAGSRHLVTAHTLDDQAETVLFRLARGSGVGGLGGMVRSTPLDGLTLLRPLLGVPKARLVATLEAERIPFVDDPSNRDPRFARPRWRRLMPELAAEGLDAQGLARLAKRMARANAAIEFAVDAALRDVSQGQWRDEKPIVLDCDGLSRLPKEIAVRLVGRAIAARGDEGPAELRKLEALADALENAWSSRQQATLRRTLAGAMVTLTQRRLSVERAPKRRVHRKQAGRKSRKGMFTKCR